MAIDRWSCLVHMSLQLLRLCKLSVLEERKMLFAMKYGIWSLHFVLLLRHVNDTQSVYVSTPYGISNLFFIHRINRLLIQSMPSKM